MDSLTDQSVRRVAICPRVSTDDQQDGASLSTQEAAMRQRCAVLSDQRNLVANLAKVEGAAADLVSDQINTLEKQRARLSAELTELRAKEAGQRAARQRTTNAIDYVRRVAVRTQTATYEKKRLALEALDARVRVWRQAHEPHYELRLHVPVSDGTTREVVYESPTGS